LNIPRIVLAGTTSGIGKTSITSAIIYGMKKRGYKIQPFKVGPDYIDPSYLTAVSGKNTRNLDPWLMGTKDLVKSFVTNSQSDISIIEGVMGLYDGFSGNSNYSSTHHVATILKTPVILVLDASKTARSIAATALGFKKFHKNSRIVGFILNKLGSKKHEILCRNALEPLKTPILGTIQKISKDKLFSRHMGLIPVGEQRSLNQKINKIARQFSESIEIDKIINITKKTSSLPKIHREKKKKPKTTIAIALDSSFNFYYQDNLESLRMDGAKLEFFSPISDSKIPQCDGVYVGGGFPEILGYSLEKNHRMKKNIKALAENNMPIYAECGGLMYLTRSINYGKKKFRMVGLFDIETKMNKKMTLNYTKGSIKSTCIISNTPKQFHGHEFHYSEICSLPKDPRFAYILDIGQGINKKRDGMMEYNTLASYNHLYFGSTGFAKNFVNNCEKFSRR